MKYSQPKNTSESIVHQFSSEATEHYRDGKRWNNIDMNFREIKTNSSKRSFEFTIRYGSQEDNEYKVNQFDMDEDEIKQFLNIVHETVYNPPKFKDDYLVGDKFIINSIVFNSNEGRYLKKTEYTNVESKIIACYNLDGIKYYALQFDGNTIFVSKNYIDGLEKLTDETN